MQFRKFWHKCSVNEPGLTTTLFASSDHSAADARQKCEQKKAQVLEELKRTGDYDYEVDPGVLREPLLHEISDDAVVTLNRYGAQVLNVSDLGILDLDSYVFNPGCFAGLLGKKTNWESAAMDHLRETSAALGIPLRVYRTANGLRAILLDGRHDPTSDRTQEMMRQFKVDERYARMCILQDCFRARLTPKPFRIQQRRFPAKFPFTSEEEVKVKAWLDDYEQKCTAFQTCAFIEELGPPTSLDATMQKVIAFHDKCCQIDNNRPLA